MPYVALASTFASTFAGWTNVTKYYLVDPWAHQEDYVDGANRAQEEQVRERR